MEFSWSALAVAHLLQFKVAKHPLSISLCLNMFLLELCAFRKDLHHLYVCNKSRICWLVANWNNITQVYLNVKHILNLYNVCHINCYTGIVQFAVSSISCSTNSVLHVVVVTTTTNAIVTATTTTTVALQITLFGELWLHLDIYDITCLRFVCTCSIYSEIHKIGFQLNICGYTKWLVMSVVHVKII